MKRGGGVPYLALSPPRIAFDRFFFWGEGKRGGAPFKRGREGLLALLLQGRGRERALVVPDKLGKGGSFFGYGREKRPRQRPREGGVTVFLPPSFLLPPRLQEEREGGENGIYNFCALLRRRR